MGRLSVHFEADVQSNVAPSDIVYFDDCKPDPEPIAGIFYRWKVAVLGKTIVVSG